MPPHGRGYKEFLEVASILSKPQVRVGWVSILIACGEGGRNSTGFQENGRSRSSLAIAMMRTPDGHGRVELIRVDAPPGGGSPEAAPPNRPGLRTVAFEVDDVRATVAGLRERGFDLVGELADFEDGYRLCYVRGPEGIIVMLAESLTIGRGNGQR